MNGAATDFEAPYARVAVGGLVCRWGPHPESVKEDNCQWLLLRRADLSAHWDPPGGRLERGEDLFQGVLREVREETGLAVHVAGPCYACLTVHKGERLLVVSMACRLVAASEAENVILGPEHTGWGWKTGAEWVDMAGSGLSSWSPADVIIATALARTTWEVVGGPGF
jgi:ADP-ribose pyrophosphatase YjhB (NUDIX family)